MKNRRDTLRVLLDTSFILPTLGIDVGEEVSNGLKRLADVEAEIYYSRFSLLESLWVAARLAKSATLDSESFSLGLRSVIEEGRYKRVDEDSGTFSNALRLYMMGHKDMIDNILYTNSTHLELRLLTPDKELKEFIRNRGLKDTLISPEQIA
ncbi:MAG: PIN domain-containing protein [Candidatus Bathyarchaeia archaeon]